MKKLCIITSLLLFCGMLISACSRNDSSFDITSEAVEATSSSTESITNSSPPEITDNTEIQSLITDDGNFTYEEENDHIIITKYIGESETIVTPEKINDKPVTKIGESVFTKLVLTTPICDNPGIDDWEYELLYGNAKHIVVSEGVTELGDYAFSDSNIESVELPATIVSVGEGCFRESSVKYIEFTSLQPVTVADEAFQLCSKLESISAYEFVNFNWDSIAFCEVLTTVNGITANTELTGENPLEASEFNYNMCRRFGAVQSGEWWYRVVDGKAEIADYVGDNKNLIIPNEIDGYTVVSIGSYAFCSNITGDGHVIYIKEFENITIPDTVKTIAAYAFYNTPLKNIDLPAGLIKIGYQAFVGTFMEMCSIPSSVEYIDEQAFDEDTILVDYELNDEP